MKITRNTNSDSKLPKWLDKIYKKTGYSADYIYEDYKGKSKDELKDLLENQIPKYPAGGSNGNLKNMSGYIGTCYLIAKHLLDDKDGGKNVNSRKVNGYVSKYKSVKLGDVLLVIWEMVTGLDVVIKMKVTKLESGYISGECIEIISDPNNEVKLGDFNTVDVDRSTPFYLVSGTKSR